MYVRFGSPENRISTIIVPQNWSSAVANHCTAIIRDRIYYDEWLGYFVGSKTDWNTRHNKELHDLYSSPNIILLIRSRRVGWVGHVARRGKVHTRFWWGNVSERVYFEELGVDWRIILKLIFKKWNGGHGLD